tara:strand:+ start:666 stop:1457 length:792 start_codon:yes stop_codon:yes gene_type:complete
MAETTEKPGIITSTDGTEITLDGVSTDLWTSVTTKTTILFYSASVLTAGAFDDLGYVNNLDFKNNREVYYESSVYEVFGSSSDTLVLTDTTESFKVDALYVPDGGVGILAEYGGDSTDTTAEGIEHAHEYNLSDYTMSPIFVETAAAHVEAAIGNLSSLATKPAGSEANYLIPKLEAGEVDGLRATFGYDTISTISASINNRIDLLAEDIYNTIPVNKYVFEKTNPIDLGKENFQPITAGELSGIGLSSAITSGSVSTTPTGY